jgi:hypothetical protein
MANLGLTDIGEVVDVRSLTQMRLGSVGKSLFLAVGNSRSASSSISASACVAQWQCRWCSGVYWSCAWELQNLSKSLWSCFFLCASRVLSVKGVIIIYLI